MSNYGTPEDGDLYFAQLFKKDIWKNSSRDDKQASLNIDRFNFVGCPATTTQTLQCPRGLQTSIPTDIIYATYEEAYQVLSGKDIEDALNEYRIQERRFANIHTIYIPGVKVPQHVAAGILSSKAWRLIYPYLSRPDEITLVRV
jgi:hypothetical protein